MITLKENQLQKLFYISFWNLEAVCSHIRTQWQVLSLSKSESLTKPIHMQLSQNLKRFFQLLFCISGIYIKFWILSKQSWASQVISYWNYRQEKAELLKSPKNPVSEHLWAVNMLKGRKHCLNPHGSIFVIFFDHSPRKSGSKSLF